MTHEKKYLAKSRATATANVHHMCNAHWVWRRPIPMLDGHAYAFKLAKQFAISRLLFAVLAVRRQHAPKQAMSVATFALVSTAA